MRKLTTEEMQNVSGGTMRCSTCGYETDSILMAGWHGGIFPWHFWGGGHWEIV